VIDAKSLAYIARLIGLIALVVAVGLFFRGSLEHAGAWTLGAAGTVLGLAALEYLISRRRRP
jgi:uncharacterized membrane protein